MGKLGNILNAGGDHSSRPTDEKRECPNCFKKDTIYQGKCDKCGAQRV